MATSVRPVGHFSNDHHHHAPWLMPGRLVVGFQPQPAQQSAITQSVSASRRSLLSERLHSKDVAVVYHECADAASSDEEEDRMDCFDGDGTDDGCTFAEDDWSWLDAQESSTQESDRSSHASSQPIAIPASCYFKDEVQRQALEKLNQKRKWYQQQLEAERMVARSMAKSRQASAAARGNKPAGRPGAPA